MKQNQSSEQIKESTFQINITSEEDHKIYKPKHCNDNKSNRKNEFNSLNNSQIIMTSLNYRR